MQDLADEPKVAQASEFLAIATLGTSKEEQPLTKLCEAVLHEA